MPYTLLKYLGWLIAALALGLLIGWWLWGRRTTTVTTETTSTGDGAATSDASTAADADAAARHRAALADLEADRDRLAGELAECREAADARAAADASAAASVSDATPVAGLTGVAGLAGLGVGDMAELESLRAQVAERDATIGELRVRAWNAEAKVGELQAAAGSVAPPAPDVSGATEVLGKKITLDDLKVVEGIGPKIEELCHGKDIRTWWGLATTDVAVLRAMLDEAGPRFQMHDPSSWPDQGRLLARGQWSEFKELTDRLTAGRDNG